MLSIVFFCVLVHVNIIVFLKELLLLLFECVPSFLIEKSSLMENSQLSSVMCLHSIYN